MQYSTAVLGSGTVTRLHERVSVPVLTIGRDVYTRFDLARVECLCFVAAARLNDAIARLKVESTRDLYQRIEPEQLAIPLVGAFAFAVLGACFEIRKVGTLDDWFERTRHKHEKVVTVHTIKTRIHNQTTTTTRHARNGARDKRKGATTTT